jgi:TIR domain
VSVVEYPGWSCYPATNALRSAPPANRLVDVFLSHAREDKRTVARPLCHALRARGLQVWFDESALRVGSNFRGTIDKAICATRFAVVILSPSFLGESKYWTRYEFDGFIAIEQSTQREMILPVWHGVTEDDVTRWSPSLAMRFALKTADRTLSEIADQIVAEASTQGTPLLA